MAKQTVNFSVNSLSAQHRQMIKKGIEVICDSFTRTDAEKDMIAGELDALNQTTGIPVALARRLAKTKHDSSFTKDNEDHRLFETLYETVVNPS